MGQITDSLRATLRELAQSDARLYRGLQEELGDTGPASDQPPPLLEGEARASREDLEGLSIAALWKLCKERGIRGLSKGPRPEQVDALLRHPDGLPLRSELPVKAARGGKAGDKLPAGTKVSGLELQHLEQRLERLEKLVLLIAQQVGVPQQAIDQLLSPSVSPPP